MNDNSGVLYGIWVARHFGDQAAVPALSAGLAGMWNPGPLLMMQLIWVAIFLYTGLSRVTAATIEFPCRCRKDLIMSGSGSDIRFRSKVTGL